MDTRPDEGSPLELTWLRGFEAGVTMCRADRNQVIRELIEKIGPKASVYSYNRYGGGELEWDYNVAEWLKDQLKGE